jgi:hypothetical protein
MTKAAPGESSTNQRADLPRITFEEHMKTLSIRYVILSFGRKHRLNCLGGWYRKDQKRSDIVDLRSTAAAFLT